MYEERMAELDREVEMINAGKAIDMDDGVLIVIRSRAFTCSDYHEHFLQAPTQNCRR